MPALRFLFFGFLCLRLLGGDFAVLQVVAWAGMMVDRAPSKGLAQAVESTFSGDEPCSLCCVLAKARSAEREREKDTPGAPAGGLKACVKEMVNPEQPRVEPPADTYLLAVHPGEGNSTLKGTGDEEPSEPPPRNGMA